MTSNTIQTLTTDFESFVNTTDEGIEFWLARDLQHLLGYTKTEKELSKVIYEQTGGNQNFAIIRSKGDQALFNHTTAQIKAKYKIKDAKPLADFMPTILLKAKDFATEITIHNSRENSMSTENEISNEHVTNNKTVRNTLISRGITPENLPAQEDVKKVERKLNSDDKKSIKNIDRLGKNNN